MARLSLRMMMAMTILLFAMVDAQPHKPKQVKCKDKHGYPMCGGTKFTCPAACPRSCMADCELCRAVCSCDKGGAVCQDPRFIGGDGITFYFHGRKDKDFCLLSDSNLHINAHFIGRRNPEMKRDFTWVQSILVLFEDHQLYIGAQKTSTWDDAEDRLAISFDGEPIVLPKEEDAKWPTSTKPAALSIVRSSSANAITVEVEGKFKISASVVPVTEEESRVHNYGVMADDCFAHLELGFKFYSLTNHVHGVLGQTYRQGYVSRVKMPSDMPIMSGEHKFLSSGLYATDCAVARFVSGPPAVAALGSELVDITCISGMSGRGIVCKK